MLMGKEGKDRKQETYEQATKRRGEGRQQTKIGLHPARAGNAALQRRLRNPAPRGLARAMQGRSAALVPAPGRMRGLEG